jgi:hypothetical protein
VFGKRKVARTRIEDYINPVLRQKYSGPFCNPGIFTDLKAKPYPIDVEEKISDW